jgi:uncharacterized protein YjiS (DUF1127 family)
MTDLGESAMACLDAAPPPAFTRRNGHPFAPVQWISRGLALIVEWQERAEQRANLAGMDERMRKDIGISYADAAREADKPFWRP